MQLQLRQRRIQILFLSFLLFGFNSFSQSIIRKRLKNGNAIYFTNPANLYLWADTSMFNPASLLKNGNYNIVCYTIIPLKPDNLIQLYGLKQYSDNFLTHKEFNAQLVSIYKKKLHDTITISNKRNATIDQVLEKFIS